MANSGLLPSFLAIMFFSVSVATSTFPIALPGCEDPELCGNVSIPFPFGTRASCYHNEHFLIECNKSFDGTFTAFLRKSVFTVTNISLEGQMEILGDTGTDCYFPENNTRWSDLYYSPWSRIGKPMVINSTANKFIAIGCDTYATVRGSSSSNRTFTTGCMSVCFDKDDVTDGACSGIGCCQTSIPEGTWSISVKLSSYYNHSYVSDFNPCSYAFVVQESAFHFRVDNLNNTASSVPVVVDWVVAYNVTCDEAKKNSTNYICSSQNSECYDQKGAVGYRCRCAMGFEGNPYLPNNGCRDIDECVSSSLHSCPENSTCVNTSGSYNCSCNQGYHQGGNVKECIADQPRGKRNLWPIYAVVGVSGSSAVLIFLSFCLYSKYIRRKEDKLRQEYYRKNGGFLLQEELSTRSKNGATGYSSTIFTEEELRKATNDFDSSQIIGEGGFGTVYKGELANKTIVAIKKSKGVNQREVGQFINEVILLSKINDQNVVKLLGCCLQTEVPLLVYEFISNGTLFEHLHIRRNVNNASKLSWSIRLRIASEVARVLSYLHSFSSPPIIHRDIKSCNILLDDNYKAKVADFGISRLVTVDENQLSTIVQGTPGYSDPEYMHTGVLTEKSDVYSFGIVLIELLSGRKVFSGDRPEAERFLSNCFLRYLEDGNLVGVLDHNMVVNDGNVKQMKEVALIAKRCIGVKGEDRPCMKEVASQLETLEMEAHPLFFQTLEIESVESEALLGKKYAESYAVSDGYNCTSTSGDLYPVTTTTIQQMMSPTDCGR